MDDCLSLLELPSGSIAVDVDADLFIKKAWHLHRPLCGENSSGGLLASHATPLLDSLPSDTISAARYVDDLFHLFFHFYFFVIHLFHPYRFRRKFKGFQGSFQGLGKAFSRTKQNVLFVIFNKIFQTNWKFHFILED